MTNELLPPVLPAYATRGQRFGAYVIDFVVWAPVMFLNYYLGGDSPEAGMVANISNAGLWLLYVVYCHGRFGKTFGKHLMRIRVVRTEGGAIGMGQAWRRVIVDLGFAIFTEAGGALALARIDEETYVEQTRWLRPLAGQAETEPGWSEALGWVWLAWMAGSFVFLAVHRRRRAPHDLIAGTIVVAEPR